jgi:hypothetical protein
LCTLGKTSRSATHREIALGQARLTLEFFAVGLPKKNVYIGGMSILSILIILEPRCHMIKRGHANTTHEKNVIIFDKIVVTVNEKILSHVVVLEKTPDMKESLKITIKAHMLGEEDNKSTME